MEPFKFFLHNFVIELKLLTDYADNPSSNQRLLPCLSLGLGTLLFLQTVNVNCSVTPFQSETIVGTEIETTTSIWIRSFIPFYFNDSPSAGVRLTWNT